MVAAVLSQSDAHRDRFFLRRRLALVPFPRSIVIVLGLLLTTGCATTEDLQRVKAELHASLDSTKTEMDKKLTPLVAQVEALKGETKAGFESTRKRLEEEQRLFSETIKAQQEALSKLSGTVQGLDDAMRTLSQHVTAHQATLASVSDTVTRIRAEVADLSSRTETLMKETAALRGAVHGGQRAMVELLKTEEATFQERLRTVQSILREFGGPEEKAQPGVQR